MSEQYREFPINWAKDELTNFIDKANSNVVGTFVNNKIEYPIVSTIDNIFLEIISGLVNPQLNIEPLLLMRSHAAYRAAYRAASLLAMAGMNPEVFTQARGCLEISLYALHINRNPGFDEIWLRRHDDKSSLKKTKNEFKFSNVIQTFESEDMKNAVVARNLYERTIDFGAHPNERVVTANLMMEEIIDGQKLSQTYLACNDLPQRHSLKTTAQVGLCSLYAFRLIFKARFDILDLTTQMDNLRSRL